MQLTAVFRKVQRGYVGFVEEVPGARTRGRTIDEVRARLANKVELVLEANRVRAERTLKGKKVVREKLPLPGGMTADDLLRHLRRFE